MAELLDRVIEAAGGQQRWSRIDRVSVHARVGGTMWGRRGQEDVIADTFVTVATGEQHTTYEPFGRAGQISDYRPDRVVVSRDGGAVVVERNQPREAFGELTPSDPWRLEHAAYFAGYAMWTYLNVPFVLAWPGVEVAQLDPWPETSDWTGGRTEVWRRLQVTFPDDIATHNKVQTLYFDKDLQLRRHDYNADVFGGVSTAQYCDNSVDVDGIRFPTRRRVVPRLPDGTTVPGPVLVAIDLDLFKLHAR